MNDLTTKLRRINAPECDDAADLLEALLRDLPSMQGKAEALHAENARLQLALQTAYDHLDMASLRISHCKDAAQIETALRSLPAVPKCPDSGHLDSSQPERAVASRLNGDVPDNYVVPVNLMQKISHALHCADVLIDAVPTRLQDHADDTLAAIGKLVNGKSGVYHIIAAAKKEAFDYLTNNHPSQSARVFVCPSPAIAHDIADRLSGWMSATFMDHCNQDKYRKVIADWCAFNLATGPTLLAVKEAHDKGQPNEQEGSAVPAPVGEREALIRFRPGCGSVGAVEAKFRDCCPDGSQARMIPEALAHKCHDLFGLALKAALSAPVPEVANPDELDPPELLSVRLINAWCEHHGKLIPWDKAIEITAVITKMPEAEKQRLLSMDDEPTAPPLTKEPTAAKQQGSK